MTEEIPPEVSAWFSRIGSKGRASQMASTTHEERSEKARKGALKHWRTRRKKNAENKGGQSGKG